MPNIPFFAEGSRGHLGKRLIKEFKLDEGADAQHYGIGLKELWDIDPAKHKEGLHYWLRAGRYLAIRAVFFISRGNNRGGVGLIVDLNYSNPYLSPYDEFQRLKHHPVIAHI